MNVLRLLKNRNVLTIFFIVLLCILIWAGFGKQFYQVDTCRSVVSKYVTAEFSEVVTGIDVEGHMYSEIDSWSERASEVYTEVTLNSQPVYPPMPEHDKSFKHESGFDNFRFHTDAKLIVTAVNSEGRTSFTESISEAGACIDKLETYITVNTWWTITYSGNFDA